MTTTDFRDYTVKHADRFRNAAMVRDCPGPISLTTDGPCIRCGYPTTTVPKATYGAPIPADLDGRDAWPTPLAPTGAMGHYGRDDYATCADPAHWVKVKR